MFGTILKRGWYPTLITIIAVLSLVFYDTIPYTVVVPVLVVLLFIGIIIAIIGTRQERLQGQSVRLSQMATHFQRRFTGNSTLSVFAIIDSLFEMENQQVWEWARGCEMARKVYDSWAENFADRVESDLRSRHYIQFLKTHINELWSLNNHYYEFIEQFSEIARRFEVPADTIEQYGKFIEEYNLFVQNFREAVNELKAVARTQLEAPSIKLAPEITRKATVADAPPPESPRRGGRIDPRLSRDR